MQYTEDEIKIAMLAHNCTEEEAIATYCEQIRTYRAAEELQRQAVQYKFDRQQEYPSFADQFDILYHGGYDAWKASIDVVKNKYPKE